MSLEWSGVQWPGEASATLLPHEIQLGPQVGAGQRASVFLGRWRGDPVVVKLYHREQIRKYRHRFGACIATYEFARNASLYAIDAIRPYIARPYGVWEQRDSGARCFVQQYVPGGTLAQLVGELGRVPPEIVACLEMIVQLVARVGVYDLDLKPHNVGVRQQAGQWHPILFDFNFVPHFRRAPNPWIAFLYRVGVRDRGYRDRRHLRSLRQLAARPPAPCLVPA